MNTDTTHEPLSAILAEMRRDARSGEHADGPLIEDYAGKETYKRIFEAKGGAE